MKYVSETAKIYSRVEKYLGESQIDIACGNAKITPNAFGVDGRDFECVNYKTDDLYGLPKRLPELVGTFSTLYSGHTLEHLHDSYRAIFEWQQFIKQGGYLILYLPDGEKYSNEENQEHMQDTRYKPFMLWFTRTFCGLGKNFKGEQYMPPIFELVESGQDPDEEDMYSFYVVARKL